MKKLGIVLLALVLCLGSALALAEYPDRPVTMIIPYAAGGTTDVYGRTLAALLEEQLGQSITVVNQGGASGSIGSQYVYDQPADGYTLLVCAETMGTYRTMGVCDLGYDNFTVISPLVGDPKIIVVGKDSPYNTLEKLLAAIKEKPGKVTMAHSGPGGSGRVPGLRRSAGSRCALLRQLRHEGSVIPGIILFAEKGRPFRTASPFWMCWRVFPAFPLAMPAFG